MLLVDGPLVATNNGLDCGVLQLLVFCCVLLSRFIFVVPCHHLLPLQAQLA